jgi:hypothetical protein
VLATATISDGFGSFAREWTWYGDLDADARSEAVGCGLTFSGSGYPITVLGVFSRPGDHWQTALAQLADGEPVDVRASPTGLGGLFRQHYVAATCHETKRLTWTWEADQLVLTGQQVVERTKEPVGGPCPWE